MILYYLEDFEDSARVVKSGLSTTDLLSDEYEQSVFDAEEYGIKPRVFEVEVSESEVRFNQGHYGGIGSYFPTRKIFPWRLIEIYY